MCGSPHLSFPPQLNFTARPPARPPRAAAGSASALSTTPCRRARRLAACRRTRGRRPGSGGGGKRERVSKKDAPIPPCLSTCPPHTHTTPSPSCPATRAALALNKRCGPCPCAWPSTTPQTGLSRPPPPPRRRGSPRRCGRRATCRAGGGGWCVPGGGGRRRKAGLRRLVTCSPFSVASPACPSHTRPSSTCGVRTAPSKRVCGRVDGREWRRVRETSQHPVCCPLPKPAGRAAKRETRAHHLGWTMADARAGRVGQPLLFFFECEWSHNDPSFLPPAAAKLRPSTTNAHHGARTLCAPIP